MPFESYSIFKQSIDELKPIKYYQYDLIKFNGIDKELMKQILDFDYYTKELKTKPIENYIYIEYPEIGKLYLIPELTGYMVRYILAELYRQVKQVSLRRLCNNALPFYDFQECNISPGPFQRIETLSKRNNKMINKEDVSSNGWFLYIAGIHELDGCLNLLTVHEYYTGFHFIFKPLNWVWNKEENKNVKKKKDINIEKLILARRFDSDMEERIPSEPFIINCIHKLTKQ
jgi:hypothetical protein